MRVSGSLLEVGGLGALTDLPWRMNRLKRRRKNEKISEEMKKKPVRVRAVETIRVELSVL